MDGWFKTLTSDQLRFLGEVSHILQDKLGESLSLTSATDDIRDELAHRKVEENHPFKHDPSNTLVNNLVRKKVKAYKKSMRNLRAS